MSPGLSALPRVSTVSMDVMLRISSLRPVSDTPEISSAICASERRFSSASARSPSGESLRLLARASAVERSRISREAASRRFRIRLRYPASMLSEADKAAAVQG